LEPAIEPGKELWVVLKIRSIPQNRYAPSRLLTWGKFGPSSKVKGTQKKIHLSVDGSRLFKIEPIGNAVKAFAEAYPVSRSTPCSQSDAVGAIAPLGPFKLGVKIGASADWERAEKILPSRICYRRVE
jgi:hypothetical protein